MPKPEIIKICRTNDKSDMINWWFAVAILTLLPKLISILIDLFTVGQIDWLELFGNGEMIMTSSILCIASSMHGYNKADKDRSSIEKIVFYCSLLFGVIIAVIYALVKSNSIDISYTIVLSVLSSIIAFSMSYAAEAYVQVRSVISLTIYYNAKEENNE